MFKVMTTRLCQCLGLETSISLAFFPLDVISDLLQYTRMAKSEIYLLINDALH